ncbi:hypothetical protein OESDEN_06067 [Oesophagostomum dentatum]|uniref:Uncharacterized protein n=1 Tax=Oesophagostomum dentatum TaxID=61180 RepID=A0A0B1T9T9_OESDE|nr:hypothetical protein OESDEN_06067 [Oesophagostomum dentatum]
MAVSIPSAAVLPVKPFRNRYVCSVSSGAPLGYTLTRVVLYIGCLCVLLVCLSAIFKKRGINSLPQQTQDYSDFIRRNRARQEYLSRAKLVVLLVCTFILVAGPYITLSFTFEITNSMEFVAGNELLLEIPQDADTLITWLMFLFPLLSPIIIFCWCTDVWSYTKELFCCRSDSPPTVGYFTSGYNKGVNGVPPVMTLVATPEGLQLKLPSSGLSPPENSNQTLAVPQQYPQVQVPDVYPTEIPEQGVREVRELTKPTSTTKTESTAVTSAMKKSPAATQKKSRIKPPAAKGVVRPVKGQGGGVVRGKTTKKTGANARRPK